MSAILSRLLTPTGVMFASAPAVYFAPARFSQFILPIRRARAIRCGMPGATYKDKNKKLSVLEPAILNELAKVGRAVPEQVTQAIRELGETAVPGLVVLLEGGARTATAPGGSWVPVHAARLLGELGAPSAIEPLLRVVKRADVASPLAQATRDALRRFGAAIVEPALAALGAHPDDPFRQEVCALLAVCGARDPWILEQLRELLRFSPGAGAALLRRYGDPAALPELEATLRVLLSAGEIPSDALPLAVLHTLDNLVQAYESLGAELPADLAASCVERRHVYVIAAGGDPAGARADASSVEHQAVRQLERHPEQPWLWSATCTTPGCPCRDARVILAKRREDLEAARALLQAHWRDKSVSSVIPSELAAVIAAGELDIDSGTFQPFPLTDTATTAETGGATANGAGSAERREGHGLWDVIDGPLLDELNDQWLAAKGKAPASALPDSLTEYRDWRPPGLVPYGWFFERSRFDRYEDGGERYLVLDHHCPIPDCPCGEVVLDWQWIAGPEEAQVSIGDVRWRPGRPPEFKGKDTALLRRLWARFVERYPNHSDYLTQRSLQTRQVGALLVAQLQANRQSVKPRGWVSTSAKGRKNSRNRAQSKDGRK